MFVCFFEKCIFSKYILLPGRRTFKTLSEYEKEEKNYYKPVRVSNFWSNNYVEYKSSADTSKTLSVEEYLNKIRPYLKDIIDNLKNSDKSV